MLDRWRAWRLERAELRLADLKHYNHDWRWSNTPSERHRLDKRIARAEAKVARLEAR